MDLSQRERKEKKIVSQWVGSHLPQKSQLGFMMIGYSLEYMHAQILKPYLRD